MSLEVDFSHYQKHGDKKRKPGNNFFQDIGTIDYRSFEQLQNSHSLYVILTPPMDLNKLGNNFSDSYERGNSGFLDKIGSFAGKAVNFMGGADCGLFSDAEDQSNLNLLLDYYQNYLISGHLLRCSSLLEGITGLKPLSIQSEKLIENNVGKGLSMPIGRTKGEETEMTLSFNETTDLDTFNTFFTIMSYQRSVIEGSREPIEEFILNGIIDYMFQIYVINFDKTGRKVLSTVKLSNITLKSLSAETLESTLQSSEHKKTTVTVDVRDFVYNDYGVFKELEDYGVLPANKYRFNMQTKMLELVSGGDFNSRDFRGETVGMEGSGSNHSGSSFFRDVGRTMFPKIGGAVDKIFNSGGCASNTNKISALQSLSSGIGGL